MVSMVRLLRQRQKWFFLGGRFSLLWISVNGSIAKKILGFTFINLNFPRQAVRVLIISYQLQFSTWMPVKFVGLTVKPRALLNLRFIFVRPTYWTCILCSTCRCISKISQASREQTSHLFHRNWRAWSQDTASSYPCQHWSSQFLWQSIQVILQSSGWLWN